MKKFTVIFVLLTISILMFMFPLGSNAASVESFVPTFLPAISGVNNIDFNLTADLDEDDPLLNTTIPVHSDTNNIIKLTLPVYARLCDIDEAVISLKINGDEITPDISYSKKLYSFPSSLSHTEVLAMKIATEMPDLSLPCYYYSFSSESEGTVSFTIPQSTVTFISLSSYSYSSENRKYDVKIKADNIQSIYAIGADLTVLDTSNVTVEKEIMTCSEFLNDILGFISYAAQGKDIDYDKIREIIYLRFADYISSEQYNLNVYDLINAPFDYGYIYFDYKIKLSRGESLLILTQPFLNSTDHLYEPEVQNFHITVPANSHIRLRFNTDRYILDDGASFTKENNSYLYNGTITDHITIDVCSSNTPTAVYQTNQNNCCPIWSIVILSICGVCLIGGIVAMITIFLRNRY